MDWDEYHGFLRPMTDEEKRAREGGIMDDVLERSERRNAARSPGHYDVDHELIETLAAEVRALRRDRDELMAALDDATDLLSMSDYLWGDEDFEKARRVNAVFAAMASRGEDS